MAWKRKVSGSILAVIGFMLSPLSWWNDAFVNFPLALGFAWLVAAFWPAAFDASLQAENPQWGVRDLGIATAPDLRAAVEQALGRLAAEGRPTCYLMPHAGKVLPCPA